MTGDKRRQARARLPWVICNLLSRPSRARGLKQILQERQAFELLRNLVWLKSGIYFEASKRPFFLRRLQRRMNQIGCSRLSDYYTLLTANSSQQELSELLKLLTTTETYFFRNSQQLQSFQQEVLPAIIKKKRKAGLSHLYIWSAGCASGEEPYTLAMMLQETLPDFQDWKISLVGTDINTSVLEKARQGLYAERSLRDTPQRYKAKYFVKEADSIYRIRDEVKQVVTFRPGNLIETRDSNLIQNVDCIFCRNVLIYFNIESCRKVVEMFYDNLAPQGYLFLGHSESLYRITAIFKLVKLQHSLVYYKE